MHISGSDPWQVTALSCRHASEREFSTKMETSRYGPLWFLGLIPQSSFASCPGINRLTRCMAFVGACPSVCIDERNFVRETRPDAAQEHQRLGDHPDLRFDQDSCYPSIADDCQGEQSDGLKPAGSLAGGCRPHIFLGNSDTYHRNECLMDSNVTYCGHMFTLYFQKDQVMPFFSLFGHRHDFEEVIVSTTDGNVTHGSASAYGRTRTKRAEKVSREGRHLKFMYHTEGLFTHLMRFAMKKDVEAENL